MYSSMFSQVMAEVEAAAQGHNKAKMLETAMDLDTKTLSNIAGVC